MRELLIKHEAKWRSVTSLGDGSLSNSCHLETFWLLFVHIRPQKAKSCPTAKTTNGNCAGLQGLIMLPLTSGYLQ